MVSDATTERLTQNLMMLRETVARACDRARRSAEDVRLVAVTKYVDATVICALLRAGVVDLGENRVQQLTQRAEMLGASRSGTFEASPTGGIDAQPLPRWHMIGHLQRNKVKTLLRCTQTIHSLDSDRLAREIEDHAARMEISVDALVEVNVSGEESKEGISPDALPPLAEAIAGCPHVVLRGLMTMAPLSDDPETARPTFARLRELLALLRGRGDLPTTCSHLSMGMSQDYAVAVEEGATLIRVGSALFDGLRGELPAG